MKREVVIRCKGARLLAIDDMYPIQGNLKDLSEARYKKLKKEILELGYSEPISVWFDKKAKKWCILNGTQRHRTLRMMRDEGFTVPIIPVSELQADSLAQAKLKILALTSQYGEMTEEGLYEFLHESNIHISDVESSFEFAEIDMEHFKASYYEDLTTPAEDEIPKLRKTSIKLGDLFQLGEHRLLCGDAINVVHVERLMNKNKTDLVFTDPPYNVKFNGRSGKFSVIENDDLDSKDFEVFIQAVCDSILNLAPPHYYVWCNWKFYSVLQTKLPFKACIVWAKNVFGLGNGYRHQHEFCLFNGQIDEAIANESDLWEEAKDTNYEHPTQKPIALALRALKNHSKANHIVDLFGGSGSTLIACEHAKRKCFSMEIDPQYCQVIIDRWEKLTSLKAIKIK